jgi:excisionase family DNA binding protein
MKREKITYTIEGACEYTDLSRNSIYRAIREKRIRTTKVLGRVLIPHEDLVKLVNTPDSDPTRRGWNASEAVASRPDRQPPPPAPSSAAKAARRAAE